MASQELQTLGNRVTRTEVNFSSEEPAAETEIQLLPPTDHGKAAYQVLICCTLIQAPVWGYSLGFGIFQEFYITHEFPGEAGAVATVGSCLQGINYLMMPLSFTLLTQYPQLRPYCFVVGLVITILSFVLSSYATEIWQLIASQGVLCAIGSNLLFAPQSLYLEEWFVTRKGFAYGTLWAGKSATGVVCPFLMQGLLNKYGSRVTLQAWAVAVAVITTPLLFFLKPRIPVSTSFRPRPLSWSFLKRSSFWMLQIGCMIQSFGYLLPQTYMASYAHTLGLSDRTGAILLAVFSLASAHGGVLMGYLGDRLAPTTNILISSIGSAIAVFLFWGFATQLALLAIFAIVYGFFAGGFSSTWTGILHQLKSEDDGIDTGLVMGLLLGGRGLGYVLSGPASAPLLAGAWSMSGKRGYETQYGPMILCTGATAIFGGWSWIWNLLRQLMI